MRLLPVTVKRFGESCTEEPTIALPLSRLIEPRIIRGYVRDWILAKPTTPRFANHRVDWVVLATARPYRHFSLGKIFNQPDTVEARKMQLSRQLVVQILNGGSAFNISRFYVLIYLTFCPGFVMNGTVA
jgi:hypothetical protein